MRDHLFFVLLHFLDHLFEGNTSDRLEEDSVCYLGQYSVCLHHDLVLEDL